MDDKEKQAISDEVNEIIKSRFQSINKFYLSIREIYKDHYNWPEMDPLRHEICLCIMFGLCQSAITLTNHLLESLLKNALIIDHGKKVEQTEEEIKGRAISAMIDKYSDGIKKYGDKNLDYTINQSRKLGLISKEQKKELHIFREIFRNAFGHADKNKTFGKSTMPVTGMKLENDKIIPDESGEPEVAKLLIGQVIVQHRIAQEHAVPYFQYIDNLVRQMKSKLFQKS